MVPNESGALRPPVDDTEFKKSVESITQISEFDHVDFDFETLSTKDSTDLRPEEWEEFAAYINKRQKDFDAIVCTHGTDTLAYTSTAMSFAFYQPETRGSALFTPVVFTGSQLPIQDVGSDGEKNLISAIRTSLDADQKNITDVLIAFDNVVIQAVKAYKTSDHNFNAFDAVDGMRIGTISAMGVKLNNADMAITSSSIHRQQMRATYNPDKPPPNGKFVLNVDNDSAEGIANGYIADITLHPGITRSIVDALAKDKNCLGICMTSLGAGNIPEKIIPALEEATSKYNLPIFSVSPFVGGAVHANMYEAAERAHQAGVAFPGDQSSSSVWVKSHWIIANGLGMTSKDFILSMQRVFRGEGTISEEAEVVPPGHDVRKKSRNAFWNRVLKNYTGVECYRQAKGIEPTCIRKTTAQPALPVADVAVLTPQ